MTRSERQLIRIGGVAFRSGVIMSTSPGLPYGSQIVDAGQFAHEQRRKLWPSLALSVGLLVGLIVSARGIGGVFNSA
jgi:hypothetical protein